MELLIQTHMTFLPRERYISLNKSHMTFSIGINEKKRTMLTFKRIRYVALLN